MVSSGVIEQVTSGEAALIAELMERSGRAVRWMTHARDAVEGAIGVLVMDGRIAALSVRGCGLGEVPRSIGAATRMTRLEVSANGLVRLPDELEALG